MIEAGGDIVIVGVLVIVLFFVGLRLACWALDELYQAFWACNDWAADKLNKLNKGEL